MTSSVNSLTTVSNLSGGKPVFTEWKFGFDVAFWLKFDDMFWLCVCDILCDWLNASFAEMPWRYQQSDPQLHLDSLKYLHSFIMFGWDIFNCSKSLLVWPHVWQVSCKESNLECWLSLTCRFKFFEFVPWKPQSWQLYSLCLGFWIVCDKGFIIGVSLLCGFCTV